MFRHHMHAADWQANDQNMLLEQVSDTILVSMIQSLGKTKFTGKVKGGLSPKVLMQVCDFVHAHFDRQIFLSELAEIAQLSEFHFCRMFKENLALTPQEYLNGVRVEQVKYLIAKSTLTLADIALQCGYSHQSHMGRNFKKIVGISPSQYRKQI